MEKSETSMQEMHPESSERDNKETPLEVEKAIQIHSGYAVEIPDELPPKEALQFVDEQGKFVNKKIPTKEDLARWYRKQLRVVGLLMAFAGFVLILIMLSATTKYADGVWQFGISTFGFIVDFIFGLFPESWFSWFPF